MTVDNRAYLPHISEPGQAATECLKVREWNPADGAFVYHEQCRQPVRDQCHCTVCHNTFRWLSHFDLHRHNDACVDPGALGLHKIDKIWDTFEGHDNAAAAGARLKKGRSAPATNTQAA